VCLSERVCVYEYICVYDCVRILMVFHAFVCRYDLYTTSVATAAAAKATPNALRRNRGRGTQRENTTLLGTHKTNRCSKRGWQSSSSLFRNLSLCLRPPLQHHSVLVHTHTYTYTHTHTHTLAIQRCCVLFSIRVYRILFSSPAVVLPPSALPPHSYYTCMHTYIL